MRVLTVRQPWAWAIIHGGKGVENRVRSLGPYRGPVAIHVSKTHDRAAELAAGALGRAAAAEHEQSRSYPWWSADTFGAVIGVVDLVDVHPHDPNGFVGCYCSPWARPFDTHLALANPRPLRTPIPAKGRLGLWRPDAELEAAINEQLRRGAAT